MTRYLRANAAGLVMSAVGRTDLSLLGTTTDALGRVFTIMAKADGASWGSAPPVDVAVQRWMTDGAVVSTQGYENREITFQVKISADTSVGLAAGEAALILQAQACTLLRWTSPEGALAPVTVFELWTVHLIHQFDPASEQRLTRYYTVTSAAKPWARSATLTSVPAVASGAGAPTTVDACTSLTNWAGTPGAATLVSGGTAIACTGLSLTTTSSATLTRTAVTSMTGTPYLLLDMSISGGSSVRWTAQVDGVTMSVAYRSGNLTYYNMPTGVTSFTALKVQALSDGSPGFPVSTILTINDVSKAATLPALGSLKQAARTMTVGGSVPTSGSIQVASPSATVLGTVLVYTSPLSAAGYTPALRTFRTAGNTVSTSSGAVSGSVEALVTSGVSAGVITYITPRLPEATYVVVARFNVAGAATTVNVSFASSGTNGISAALSLPSGFSWATIGAIALPDAQLAPEAAISSGLQFSGTGPTTVQLDELYLFDVTHGTLTMVNVGSTGGSPTRMWIDAPDVDPSRNRPAIYVGTAADRSNAIGAAMATVLSFGDHDLDPNGSNMFTVTDGVDNAVVTASFYHRWLTHAGD